MPILDNFESQFINDVSEKDNGLMSSMDKVKLDGLSLTDINYINNELENIKEYMVPQFIYGIKIDPNNSDPNTSVEYTDDSIGFIPLKVDQTTGECNYGSWKDIIVNILGIKPCLVKNNGDVVFNLNPDNYNKTINDNDIDIESGEFGQVMIKFKHVYYKFSIDENKIWFQISNKQVDNTWIDTAFISEDGIGTIKDEMYIAAYESVQKNNILQSVSNSLPSFKLDFEHIEISSEFGVFHMMNIIKKQFITFLGYLVTKSIDLEGNIGSGNTEGSILKTGTMNTKGLFYGKNNNTEGVKMFGIENLWGNQLKYMHGIIQKLVYVLDEDNFSVPEQHIYIKEFYPYNKIEDFTDMGKIDPNISGYISSIKFLSKSVYIPEKLNGSSTTYFKSYFQNGESKNANNKLYGVYGGSNIYGNKAGSEFLLLAYIDELVNEITTHIIY